MRGLNALNCFTSDEETPLQGFSSFERSQKHAENKFIETARYFPDLHKYDNRNDKNSTSNT